MNDEDQINFEGSARELITTMEQGLVRVIQAHVDRRCEIIRTQRDQALADLETERERRRAAEHIVQQAQLCELPLQRVIDQVAQINAGTSPITTGDPAVAKVIGPNTIEVKPATFKPASIDDVIRAEQWAEVDRRLGLDELPNVRDAWGNYPAWGRSRMARQALAVLVDIATSGHLTERAEASAALGETPSVARGFVDRDQIQQLADAVLDSEEVRLANILRNSGVGSMLGNANKLAKAILDTCKADYEACNPPPVPVAGSPETHEWVGGKCGIRTDYESVTDKSDGHTTEEEYSEGETTDCLECEDSECQAVLVRKTFDARNDKHCIELIVGVLSEPEWDADTTDRIAGIVSNHGHSIPGYNEGEIVGKHVEPVAPASLEQRAMDEASDKRAKVVFYDPATMRIEINGEPYAGHTAEQLKQQPELLKAAVERMVPPPIVVEVDETAALQDKLRDFTPLDFFAFQSISERGTYHPTTDNPAKLKGFERLVNMGLVCHEPMNERWVLTHRGRAMVKLIATRSDETKSILDELPFFKLTAFVAVRAETPLLCVGDVLTERLAWLTELQADGLVQIVASTNGLEWRYTIVGEEYALFAPRVLAARQSEQRRDAEWAGFNECQRGIIATLKHGPARLEDYPDKDVARLCDLGWIVRMRAERMLTNGVPQWLVEPTDPRDFDLVGFGLTPPKGTTKVPGEFRVSSGAKYPRPPQTKAKAEAEHVLKWWKAPSLVPKWNRVLTFPTMHVHRSEIFGENVKTEAAPVDQPLDVQIAEAEGAKEAPGPNETLMTMVTAHDGTKVITTMDGKGRLWRYEGCTITDMKIDQPETGKHFKFEREGF